jgi:hypothetical protein
VDIELNFINMSNDQIGSEIVIFQKNVATGYKELPVAWHVIRNCGFGNNHPFSYPETMQVTVNDSYGNYTPKLDAEPGQQFAVALTGSGQSLVLDGAAGSHSEVQVVNRLAQGAINASIFKKGALLATTRSLAPKQMAGFAFAPTLWIGAVSWVDQGEVMSAAMVDEIDTELSLLGVRSADIVMTGGGPGPQSTALTFTLQNVVRA